MLAQNVQRGQTNNGVHTRFTASGTMRRRSDAEGAGRARSPFFIGSIALRMQRTRIAFTTLEPVAALRTAQYSPRWRGSNCGLCRPAWECTMRGRHSADDRSRQPLRFAAEQQTIAGLIVNPRVGDGRMRASSKKYGPRFGSTRTLRAWHDDTVSPRPSNRRRRGERCARRVESRFAR